MKQLAIKGHPTRGKEVIEILEMFGGKNQRNHSGDSDDMYFYIKNELGTDIIVCDFVDDFYIWFEDAGMLLLTLEEFLEKFPYKIGDKVQDLKSGEVFTIARLYWDEIDCTVYYFNPDIIQYYNVENLKLYKENNEMSNNITLNNPDKEGEKKSLLTSLIEYFQTTPKDVLEREWNEHKELDEIGPTVEEYIAFAKSFKKQPKYPKTYCECCDILQVGFIYELKDLTMDETKLMDSFISLKRCRDAYWKIVNWKPDWSDYENIKYSIRCRNGEIVYNQGYHIHKFLAFPTEEMRNTFFENFKELIEECKELL